MTPKFLLSLSVCSLPPTPPPHSAAVAARCGCVFRRRVFAPPPSTGVFLLLSRTLRLAHHLSLEPHVPPLFLTAALWLPAWFRVRLSYHSSPSCPHRLLTIDDSWLHSLDSRLSRRSTSPHHAFSRTTRIALCHLPPLSRFLPSLSASSRLRRIFFFAVESVFPRCIPVSAYLLPVCPPLPHDRRSRSIRSIPHLHPAPRHFATFPCVLPASSPPTSGRFRIFFCARPQCFIAV